MLVLTIDLGPWNYSRDFTGIAERIVAQLCLASGVPRTALSVAVFSNRGDRLQITITALTPAQAAALYDLLKNDSTGAAIAQSNGVLTSSITEPDQKVESGSGGGRSLSPAAIGGIVAGCALLTLLFVVGAVFVVLMITKRLTTPAQPTTSDSMAELNADNVMYSQNSL